MTCLRTCGIHKWNCFELYNPLLFRLIVTCQHDENCHFYSNLECSSEIQFKQMDLNLLDDVSQLLPHVQRKLLNMKHTRKWRTCIRDIRHIQGVTNSDILCRTFSSTGRYVIGYVIIKAISSSPGINRACTCKTLWGFFSELCDKCLVPEQSGLLLLYGSKVYFGVGVRLKNNFQWEKPSKKKNLCDLFSSRIDLIMRSKKSYCSNKSFVRRQARKFVPFLIINAVKNGPLSTEAIFPRKKSFLNISKKWGRFNYVYT